MRLLLRGEIVWVKARAASGNCAWGSFQRPSNPTLRDLSERVIVASKGRFDRAVDAKKRAKRGLPSSSSMTRDEFMEATLDLWEIAPESARRVGHPAPFPVELPERLIHLYTYVGDVVLDPFMGSGTTAVAAVRTGRHYVGYDLDPEFVKIAQARVDEARTSAAWFELPAAKPAVVDLDPVAAATVLGATSVDRAEALLHAAGFADVVRDPKLGAGITVSFSANDRAGGRWLIDVAGGLTALRAGLARSETMWRTLAKAAVLGEIEPDARFVVLTADEPTGPNAAPLAAVVGAGRPIEAIVRFDTPEPLRRFAAGLTPSA